MSTEALSFDPIGEARANWVEAGWSRAAPGMAAVTSIMRCQQIVNQRAHRVLAGFGLTFAQFEALRLLAFSRRGLMPLGAMGRRLQVSPGSVTNVIDRLESKSFVVRVPHKSDLRTTLAKVTADGRRVTRAATLALNEHVFSDLGLRDDQVEVLVELLTDLRRAAGDFTGSTQGSVTRVR